MEKVLKPSTEKPTVDCSVAVKKQAQAALAALFAAVDEARNDTIFWWNVIGVNEGSLMTLLRLDVLVYHALMLVAGLVEFTKVRGANEYRLTSKKESWDEFANTYELSRDPSLRSPTCMYGGVGNCLVVERSARDRTYSADM